MVLYEETQKINSSWIFFGMMMLAICSACFFLVSEVFLLGVIFFGLFIPACLIKLRIRVYGDRIELSLLPALMKGTTVFLHEITSIDLLPPSKIGGYGLKLKRTPTSLVYYLGGKNLIYIRTYKSRGLYFSIKDKDCFIGSLQLAPHALKRS